MKRARAPLDPNVVVLGQASLLHDLSSEMVFPFLPAFLTSVLGAPPLFLGLVEGVADSVSSLLRPFFGRLSDRLGRRKPMVVGGYAVANATRPLLAVVTAPWQVLAIRVCDRLGKAMRTAPRDALLADSADPATRGRAFGFHRAMDHLGAVIGPLVASAVFIAFGRSYVSLFVLASIPGVLAVMVGALRVHERVPGRAPGTVSETETVPGAFPSNRAFLGFLAAVLLFTLGNSSDAFLLLRLEQAGVDVAALPFLWAALHAVKVASVYGCGALSDRIGRRPMILVGWLYYALVYVAFALLASPLGLAAAFVAYGLFFGLTEGAERALVAELVRPGQRGLAFGLRDAVVGVAALPSSVMMGALWQAFGAPVGFLCGASLALCAATVLAASLPRRQ